MIRAGYSATIWDGARSGIGTYIAEQLDILERDPEIDLKILAAGGGILDANQRPEDGATGHGIGKVAAPVRDILRHRSGLKKFVREHKLDLVHVPTIRRLPGKLPCATVVTVHDLGPIRMAGKYGALRDYYHRKLVPRWLEGVDAFVTPSEATRTDLVELYQADPKKITVVPNGIDHATYHPGDAAQSAAYLREKFELDGPFIVFVSRLEHPAKNHVRLIEAFEMFKSATGLPHRLVFVGSDWHGAQAIHERAANLVASGDLLITGYVEKEAMPHFLRAAESVVYPSLFEGFGLPVIEAMASGTPVACSRSSSLTEIAEGRALLFDPEDPAAIAAALENLASDPSQCEELRQLGLAHAATFTWQRCVEETIAVWKKTIANHHG
jgi:glycosyltransferase involved in cell wall biosynthesis